MTILSTLRPFLRLSQQSTMNAVRRSMSDHHRTLPLAPSRWQWNKTKDLFHYYLLLGFIPCSLVVLYANVFIGPATLSEIPEGYEPKHWEYSRSPITRFMARYLFPSPQQEYEKYLHYVYAEEEKRKLREVESKIRDLMAERADYQAYYYKAPLAKHYRAQREAADQLLDLRGD